MKPSEQYTNLMLLATCQELAVSVMQAVVGEEIADVGIDNLTQDVAADLRRALPTTSA
jgi:hypothetical protein